MSLIHRWPLNGDLKDYGINSVDLTSSGPTVDDNGKIGKCYYFNQNQYLYANSVDAGDEFSVCYWVKYTDLSYPRTHVGIKHSDGAYTGTNKGWDIGHGPSGGGSLNLDINDGTRTQRMGFTVSNISEINVWKHFAIVCSLSAKTVKLYINGTLVGTKSINSSMTSFKTNRQLTIGGLYGWSLKGYLNDFRIYDTPISAKEIKEISKALVLHYDFEDPYIEATSNIITQISTYGLDYIPSSYNGTYSKLSETFKGYPIIRCTGTSPSNSGFRYSVNYKLPANSYATYSVYLKWNTQVFSFNSYIGGVDGSGTYKDPFINAYISNTSTVTANGLEESFELYDENDNKVLWTNFEVGKWYRIVTIIKNTTASQVTLSNLYFLYGKNTSTWDISMPQLELNSHATPFTYGTRSNGIVYDCSGYNHNGTISGTLDVSSKDSRFGKYFVKVNGTVTTDKILTSTTFQTHTVSIWYKRGTTSSGQKLINFNNSYSIYYGNAQSLAYENSGNDDHYIYSTPPNDDNWHNVTWVYEWDSTASPTVKELKAYYDGVSSGNKYVGNNYVVPSGYKDTTVFFNGFNGCIADVKVFATVLSQEEIVELYNKGASIDKNGNLFASEFIEGSSDIKVNKNYIVECSEFIEGSSIAKFMKTSKKINVNEIKEI